MRSDREAMSTKRFPRISGLRHLSVVAAVLAGGQCALAQNQTTITATGAIARLLENHDVPGTDREIVLREVTFPPGRVSPVHHHMVAGLVFILEGVAESAYGSDAPKLYRAGETMQDRADVPHTLFRNADPDKPLRILIFYAAAKGQPYVVTP